MKKSIKKTKDEMILYSYYRSSASYRVRIGLNLKGLDYRIEPLHLLKMGGQQHVPEYRTLNPEGLVPLLKHGDFILSQSIAILEYLDERYPQHPFLPSDERVRAHLRALVYSIVCDIHPLNNLRVLNFLKNDLAIEDEKKLDWYHHWIDLGFAALEKRLNHSDAGTCCYMDKPTLADICLIPQIYNALRFNVDMQRYPKLLNIYEHCLTLSAFIQASAEKQIDFEK